MQARSHQFPRKLEESEPLSCKENVDNTPQPPPQHTRYDSAEHPFMEPLGVLDGLFSQAQVSKMWLLSPEAKANIEPK